KKIEVLGSEEEIEAKYGCPDGLEWAKAYVAKLNEQEKLGRQKLKIELSPAQRIAAGEQVVCSGGDLLMLPLYNRLGLNEACDSIVSETQAKYNLAEILEALVMLRIIDPCSKRGSYELNKKRIRRMSFAIEDMYRALSLLCGHINELQKVMWENSVKITERRTRVIYYDCTNYFFEIEDNDKDYVDKETGEIVIGLRKRGKSKENRPNPIVQMGMFMDMDGIPLAFVIFPGNESEQTSLQPLEEILNNQFGMNEYIVSTDAGLASESNRRYNMAEGRDYIAVQSLPSLPAKDQDMALDPRGWRVAFRDNKLPPIDPQNPEREIFNLKEIDLNNERHTKFYKEIIVNKRIDGKADTQRAERVIVTYSHDYALYLRHKREERLRQAEKIVRKKQAKSRQSQQDPRRYVETTYLTEDGRKANRIAMAIDDKAIENETRFDGFYAYGTSLDDTAIDILRARSFHHEIEHLFRTTKTFLNARPVYLQRQDRIKSHFLICFIAMTVLKLLQKQLAMPELSIDRLIDTIRSFNFDHFKGIGYRPLFERNELTDNLQALAGIQLDTEIVPEKTMNKTLRNLKNS
ncbi:MAG: hypothetical protein ACI3YT_08655, partial [Prevotella sp.]